MMESLQKRPRNTDDSGEINDDKTAYIHPIWHVLCRFSEYIYFTANINGRSLTHSTL